MSTYIEDVEDGDDATETTRLVPGETTREMHNDNISPATKFVPVKKYKDYDGLIYLSVLTILLCFPLGLAALLMALKAHEDAKKGYNVRAKKKAWITYLIIAAAIVVDMIVVVAVVAATVS
ncbi:uncharacterized protein [Dysidea avara]|uniref:uncharacterized protein n=1 Tax=Dysidea avara TaxID=196820 RepID=UPI0033288C62